MEVEELTDLLTIEDLRVELDTAHGQVRAVNGVSLTVRPGEALGIVGESGSGKSMMAKAIMGIAPRSARLSGDVRLSGEPVLGMSVARRRSNVPTRASMVFQDAGKALNPVVRIGRQLSEGMTAQLGMSRSRARERGVELLAEVGISDPERRMSCYPHELSGGMRQRAMIAIALSTEPALLIADEPTTALDVTIQRQILDLLTDARRRHQTALILISHDLGVVAGRTDRTAVMYAGRVVETAETDLLFRSPRHRYSAALIASTPALTTDRSQRLRTIQGSIPSLLDMPGGCAFGSRCSSVDEVCRSMPALVRHASERDWHECCHPLPAATHGRSNRLEAQWQE